MHRFTAERLGDDAHLSPYRAGYTPAQRREIERRLKDGDLLGVSATNALELGIDIGLLDCVISIGFPGTVASLRQQWGRAGRRGSGLAVLVATEDGLDQFFVREPDKLLGRRVEAAILDHANPRVLARSRAQRGVRSAADERRTRTCSAPRRSSWQRDDPELRRTPAGHRLGRPRPPRRARPAALDRPGRVLDRRRFDRRGARPRRARRAPTRPSTRARSTFIWASRSSCGSST